MSNETCTVTIADIYGAEWWERNKVELDREWEYGLGVALNGQKFVCMGPHIEWATCSSPRYEVRIILHRRKPKPPTLREVYGVDEVTIPAGWEWTGEFRKPQKNECYRSQCGQVASSFGSMWDPRLILRERPKKVWFKAEERYRVPGPGEYVWSAGVWRKADIADFNNVYLCATRHEEIDTTVQVVTQEDVDKCKS